MHRYVGRINRFKLRFHGTTDLREVIIQGRFQAAIGIIYRLRKTTAGSRPI